MSARKELCAEIIVRALDGLDAHPSLLLREDATRGTLRHAEGGCRYRRRRSGGFCNGIFSTQSSRLFRFHRGDRTRPDVFLCGERIVGEFHPPAVFDTAQYRALGIRA